MANIEEIEENVSRLCESKNFKDEFIYDLLLAYGKPKSSIARLKKGNLNQSKDPSEVVWKKNIYYKYPVNGSPRVLVDSCRHDDSIKKQHLRFIVASDGSDLVALDTKTEETLDIPIEDLYKHFTFFLPLAGMEKTQAKTENIADRKAAEKMAKLYDEIRKANPGEDKEFLHSLNVFFSRLLFCFFAEDTEVFGKAQFISSISSHTQENGSDLHTYLDRLFASFDEEDKSSYPEYIQAFPYVNGGLFHRKLDAPKFTTKARQLIIECGGLNWSQINPDIFGSMMQAVVHQGERATLGMHYTSVTNIMKVIDPLFMDELHEEFEKSSESIPKLNKLWDRISSIKIFDPACGSGNFLIIAYKELRKLEHKIIARIHELEFENKKTDDAVSPALFLDSKIKLDNFYGIEIEEFAQEIAILSLWIAKHQMNIEFRELFGPEIPLVPLKDAGNVVCANAARTDWNQVCKNDRVTEIYLIGNPPYLGAKLQDEEQKADLITAFQKYSYSKNLDYISIWFIKGAEYIRDTKSQLAFVSTNSICQGEHVGLLFPFIFMNDVEIAFAHTSFKWSNSAKGNAGVTCIIVSLRNISNKEKVLFLGNLSQKVVNINPYLAPVKSNMIITKKSKPFSGLKSMVFGSMPRTKYLVLEKGEAETIVAEHPDAALFIKEFIGSEDFINGKKRFCIWVEDKEYAKALEIPSLKERFENIAKERHDSKAASTRAYALKPYKFAQISHKDSPAVVFPIHSSERREYIPIGFIGSGVVVSNAANAIYDAEPWLFGLLTSRMHMVWTGAVAGRLKTDYRYSSALVYNNFPVRPLSDEQKKLVTEAALRVLAIREKHSEKTLAKMYDPDKMPDDLRAAHNELDEIVDGLYASTGFATDEERLSMLFDLYEKMIAEEKGELHA